MSNENAIEVEVCEGEIYIDVGMSTGHLSKEEALELIGDLQKALNEVIE